MAEEKDTTSLIPEEKDRNLVVIAVDGSENAEKAFNFYCDVIHKDRDKILLIHVAQFPRISTNQAMYMARDLWEQMLAKEKERVAQLEDKFSDFMKAKGLSGKMKAVFGAEPGAAIVDKAKEDKALVIIMGTRGLNKVRRTIMGSVSDYVLHHAHCPVLICRN